MSTTETQQGSHLTQNEEVLRYAREHAAEAIEEVSAEVRRQIRKVVVAYFEDLFNSNRPNTPWPRLQSMLFDRFAALNLDFDLIAQTEKGECQLQGFIATLAPGTMVKRIEAYNGACCHCQNISEQTFKVVSPDGLDKDRDTQVWRGKSRIYSMAGKSVPPGNWPSAGLQHPGCRGSWTFPLSNCFTVDAARRLDRGVK